MNLPNGITVARTLAAPVIFALILSGGFGRLLLAFILFLAAAISDIWDGYLARRRGQITDFGKLADPIADKLLVVSTFVPFYIVSLRAPAGRRDTLAGVAFPCTGTCLGHPVLVVLEGLPRLLRGHHAYDRGPVDRLLARGLPVALPGVGRAPDGVMGRELTGVEIVAVGDELLSGATLDSNAATVARRLEALGLRVMRKTTVPDVSAQIAEAVRSALARSGAVVTTGGLGPTSDDVTRNAVAGVFGRRLEFREDLWRAMETRWARRGKIPETNRVQAEVPVGAEVFPNRRGTAPGIAIEDDSLGLCIMLPGPPHEMETILIEQVVPYLEGLAGAAARRPFRRTLRTAGIAESAIAEQLGSRLDDLPLDVAHLPEVDGNDIRLTAWAKDESDVAGVLDEAVGRLRELLAAHIYGEGEVDLAQVVGDLLRRRGLRVAVAESCTAGLIGKRLTEFSGSSDYFWGGMIVYSDRAKVELLGVSEEKLKLHGAVSEEVARQMAEGVCLRSGAETAIAVTGIAGPDGGTEEKPVGTVWLTVKVRDLTVARRRFYPGTRDMVRARAAQGGLDLLRRTLLEELP